MYGLIVTFAEIRFSAYGSTDEFLISEAAKQLGLSVNDFIEDTSIVGKLHYIVHYDNGSEQRVTLPKDEVHWEWGYVFENFIYTWKMIYEWLYKKEIGDGTPFKIYASLYEAYADLLTPEDYQEFIALSEEEVIKLYGSPWEIVDDIAKNEEQMALYLNNDSVNSKKIMLTQDIYFDHLLEKWIDIEGSIEVFRQLYLQQQNNP
ncbi:hypothetical protein A6395_01515 [Exiguobacterium sp. SH31]|uniref:hypothetical protein n=1 Tax=Exiguobacterium sp. SH31 TaxID=1843183 RepID=UPI0008C7D5A1|nr:hypothetical protein [Exiguobacterium sp. SH31]OGX80450.1 hypothetical protein A6395_01515 [Exiguobacterium sp. SH31]